MSTIALIAWALVTWAIFRLLAGRATLATAQFARVFAIGALTSTALAIVAERLLNVGVDSQWIVRLWAGPIDEVAKALPLLAIVGWSVAWRRLAISDYVLLGLAGALGYAFFNWTLSELSDVEPLAWHSYLFGSLHTDSEWEREPAYFTGAIATAFVGLIASLGVRIAKRRSTVIVLVLLGLVGVAFENAMYRWQVGPISAGWPAHLQPVPGAVAALHALFLDGRIELWLLVGGLVIANWLEARWAAIGAAADQDRFLLDHDARTALVVVEWIVATQQLRYGWAAFEQINRYFRRRRAYALVCAQMRRLPSDTDLAAAAAELRQRLPAERAVVQQAPKASAPARKVTAAQIGWWIVAHRFHLLAALAFALYFTVQPNAWQELKPALFSDWSALVLAFAAIVLLVRHGLRLRAARRTRPATFNPLAADVELLLTGAAALTATLTVGVYFIPFETLVPHYGTVRLNLVEPFESWSGYRGWPLYGGNPHVLFAVAALILACIASIGPARARRATLVADTAPSGSEIAQGA